MRITYLSRNPPCRNTVHWEYWLHREPVWCSAFPVTWSEHRHGDLTLWNPSRSDRDLQPACLWHPGHWPHRIWSPLLSPPLFSRIIFIDLSDHDDIFLIFCLWHQFRYTFLRWQPVIFDLGFWKIIGKWIQWGQYGINARLHQFEGSYRPHSFALTSFGRAIGKTQCSDNLKVLVLINVCGHTKQDGGYGDPVWLFFFSLRMEITSIAYKRVIDMFSVVLSWNLQIPCGITIPNTQDIFIKNFNVLVLFLNCLQANYLMTGLNLFLSWFIERPTGVLLSPIGGVSKLWVSLNRWR